jgi:hypothetical protein
MLPPSSGFECLRFAVGCVVWADVRKMVTQIHGRERDRGDRSRLAPIETVNRKITLKMMAACFSISYLFITTLSVAQIIYIVD